MTKEEFEQLEELFGKLSSLLGGRLALINSVFDGYEVGLYDSNGNHIKSSIPQATIKECADYILNPQPATP